MEAQGKLFFFADWLAIVSANFCKLQGIDVYLQNPCDAWGRVHVYGPILLKLPLIEKLKLFYYFYLPIVFNIIFVFTIIRFFNFNKKFKNIYIVFFLFNVSTLLAIERANVDVLIFLLIVTLAFFKNSIFNIFIIIITSLSKFYPICLTIIFLYEKKFSRVFLKTLIVCFIVFFILFFYREDLINIYNNRAQFSSLSIYGFGISATIKSFSQLNNIIFLIFFFYPIYFIFKKYYNEITDSSMSYEFFNRVYFENRLYLLFSTVILICYFAFSGFIYREIFFLGLIPFIIKRYESSNQKKFFKFYFYFLILKFFFSSVLIFLNQNYIFENFQKQISLSKHLIDFYLILVVMSVFLNLIYFQLRSYFVKN